jgi:hypothetical protein
MQANDIAMVHAFAAPKNKAMTGPLSRFTGTAHIQSTPSEHSMNIQ